MIGEADRGGFRGAQGAELYLTGMGLVEGTLKPVGCGLGSLRRPCSALAHGHGGWVGGGRLVIRRALQGPARTMPPPTGIPPGSAARMLLQLLCQLLRRVPCQLHVWLRPQLLRWIPCQLHVWLLWQLLGANLAALAPKRLGTYLGLGTHVIGVAVHVGVVGGSPPADWVRHGLLSQGRRGLGSGLLRGQDGALLVGRIPHQSCCLLISTCTIPKLALFSVNQATGPT